MKRLFILAVTALCWGIAAAAPLTPDQALARIQHTAAGLRMSPASMQLVYTATETAVPAYYIFGNGNGFVLASADDLALPVLGYSDNAPFNPADMPEPMRQWLAFYAEEIEHARSLDAPAANVAYAQRPERDPIPVMVHTRWNQGSPFNMFCPSYSGTKTVTGCVATAMAQLVRFWKYPLKGTGSNSYTYNNVENSFDFGNTTFDWGNMVHIYNGSTTARQDTAVATLMRACGVSVNMMYNTSAAGGSGAYSSDVTPALVKHFGYAPSSEYHSRATYGLYDWENLVYSSLKNGCPVYYNGRGSAGGHAFVCDGYEGNGYFHFNWGWGGSSDGYFLLTALNPTTLGIGGGGGGFNTSQGAIINLRPNYDGAKARYMISYSSPFTISYSGSTLSISGFGGNTSIVNIPAIRFGFRLTGDNGKTHEYFGNTYNASLRPNYGYKSYSATVAASSLETGTYDVDPIFSVTENNVTTVYTSLVPPSMKGKYKIVKTASTATLKTRTDALLQANNFAITTPLYYGDNFGFKVDYHNPAQTEAYHYVYMGWYTASGQFLGVGDGMMKDMQPGETAHEEMVIAVPSKVSASSTQTKSLSTDTQYKVAIVVQTNSDASAPVYQAISDKVDVTINPAQDSFTLSSLGLEIANASSVAATDIKFTIKVKATSGYYCQPIYYWVRDMNAKSLLSGSTDIINVAPGETKSIDWRFAFDAAQKNTTYELILNSRINGKNTYLAKKNFTVGTVGVSEILPDANDCRILVDGDIALVSSPRPITSAALFDMSGINRNTQITLNGESASINISGLPTGIYMVRVTTACGAATLKFIKH